MPDFRSVGRAFEDRAAEYLVREGFTMLTRRFAARGGEIDLVALEGETLVFVEVKARRNGRYTPEEALTTQKMERTLAASEVYLARYDGPEREIRYDLVAIDDDGVRHYRSAFEPE